MPRPDAGRPLSLSGLTLPDASAIEVIEAAAAAEIRSVGLRLILPSGSAKPAIVGNEPLLRDIKASLDHHGVAMLEMGAVMLDGPKPSRWCRPALEAGARLGARHAVAFITEPDAGKRLDDFADLCHCAQEQGLGVAIEFVPYSAVRTLEDAIELVRDCGYANASVLVDVLHLHRSGGSVASLAAATPDVISIAQFCDAPLVSPDTLAGRQNEARCGRLDPGEGQLPLAEFLKALPIPTPIELEVPNLGKAGTPAQQRIRDLVTRTRRLLDD